MNGHFKPIGFVFASAICCVPMAACAHGFAGLRYFPPTIEIDDPFAATEIHAIAGRRPRNTEALSSRHASFYDLGGGLEVVDGFGISLDAAYRSPNDNLAPAGNGFDNLALTVKKELVIDDTHEYAITAALGVEAGGTGTGGVTRHSTYSPTLFFAKGFGDLPDSMGLLRPFAVTGTIARQTPADRQRPALLNWGFTLQYSLLYLQSYVADFGLRPPFDRLVAVIEFPVKTCLDNGCSRQTTGTFNPGVVWVGKGFNLALEAVQPINARSGHGTGLMFQFQKFFSE